MSFSSFSILVEIIKKQDKEIIELKKQFEKQCEEILELKEQLTTF
jgi:hypothetical protein